MSNHTPVASGPDLLYRLSYADPTGETAIRQVLALTRGDEFSVVDMHGNHLFFIKRSVLIESVIPHLTFTLTRRGKDNLRAHAKKMPRAVGAVPGAEPEPNI